MPKALSAAEKFGQCIQPSYQRRRLSTLCKRGEKQLRRYARSVKEDSPWQAVLKDDLLHSYSFRVLAAHQANRKLSRARRLPPISLLLLAKNLSWDCPLARKETLIVRPKKSGSVRHYFDFSVERRTIFQGLALILSCHIELRPFQFDNEGISAPIGFLKKKMSHGYRYGVQVDINSHYASFDLTKLSKELPLNAQQVDRWVMANSIPVGRIIRRGALPPLSADDLYTLAHQGIPLGSVLSSRVAQFIGSKLAWSSNGSQPMTNYADNYCALTKAKANLTKVSSALQGAVTALPGGHFSIKVEATADIHDGITFLGHYLWKTKGKLRTEPTPANQRRFYSRIDQYTGELLAISHAAKENVVLLEEAKEVVGSAYVFTRSWCEAFKACDNIHEHMRAVEAMLQPALTKVGLAFKDFKKHRNPEARWSFAELS